MLWRRRVGDLVGKRFEDGDQLRTRDAEAVEGRCPDQALDHFAVQVALVQAAEEIAVSS